MSNMNMASDASLARSSGMNGSTNGAGSAWSGSRQMALESWLDAIAKDVNQESALTAISVKHQLYNEQGSPVLGDEVFGKQVVLGKPFDARALAAEVQGRCDVFSQALPGVQTFKIFAYYGSPSPGNVHHINASGRLGSGGAAGGTEDPSPRGQAQQSMRSMDLVVNRAFGMFDRLWMVAESQIARSEENARYYQGQFREAETAFHGLVRERVAENNAHEIRMREFERATGERADLIKILPALIRHITGDDSIIPAETADTAILETVAHKLRKMPKDEQLEVMTKLTGASAELAMLLAPRLKEISDRQEREEKARRMLASAQATENVEADKAFAKEIVEGRIPTGLPGFGFKGTASGNGEGGGT